MERDAGRKSCSCIVKLIVFPGEIEESDEGVNYTFFIYKDFVVNLSHFCACIFWNVEGIIIISSRTFAIKRSVKVNICWQ